jgi:AcrR family transcriptional regulator
MKARKILAAANTVLAEKGYAATTISQVAAAAGVSRGLLHYYFKNKEEMLAKVVQANVETSLNLVATIFAECNTAEELATALTSALRATVERAPEFFHVFFESWALGRQSATIARELRTLYRRFREAIQEGLDELVSRGVIVPSLPTDGLAALLTGIFDGLGLQLVTEPELIESPSIWAATEKAIASVLGGSL